MMDLREVLNVFVSGSRDILGECLTGVYLHGSAAMGCFHAKRSDIDLLTVVREDLTREDKLRYLAMAAALHRQAPGNGLEFSVVREDVCRPFVYPTPFLLHFSAMHAARYAADPAAYAAQMHGTDRDLAAHMTVIYHRGKALCGRAIREVFAPVPERDYMDSIWSDIEYAESEITGDPVYYILNLCRVLAFRRDRLVLSKAEGGGWGMQALPAHAPLIQATLQAYRSGAALTVDAAAARAFAAEMLQNIREGGTPDAV